jgi:hypothetical protein
MGLPRGTTVPLSPLRRVMGDFLHFSRQVPLVSMERRLSLADVVHARQAAVSRPSWFAIFLKAYAMVAQGRAELRRAYLPLPWPRLHQHACNVGRVVIARQVDGEEAVLFLSVREPERQTLTALDERIRRARVEPIEQVADFRRMLRLGRLPLPLRRLAWCAALYFSGNWRARHIGTFGLTGVAALGSTQLHFLSPLTTSLTYGVLGDDGSLVVRLVYDHRVLDGVVPAAALQDLEQVLRGPIVDELRGSTRRAA